MLNKKFLLGLTQYGPIFHHQLVLLRYQTDLTLSFDKRSCKTGINCPGKTRTVLQTLIFVPSAACTAAHAHIQLTCVSFQRIRKINSNEILILSKFQINTDSAVPFLKTTNAEK